MFCSLVGSYLQFVLGKVFFFKWTGKNSVGVELYQGYLAARTGAKTEVEVDQFVISYSISLFHRQRLVTI